MQAQFRRTLLLAVGALAVFAAQAQTPVRVGSKIDTEGKLLGQVIVLVLEAKGIKIENKVPAAHQPSATQTIRTGLRAISLFPSTQDHGMKPLPRK